jgi:glycosyltransferase involved in cell wall biosynthesis
MNPNPVVSVVMPVYNGRKYLTQAVRSVLRQTFADFELVVVDDGSTDDTAEIADRLARADGRVVVLRESHNRGVAAAANLGAQRARGELIARMDGDDICRRRRFEMQVEFLGRRRECVLVGTQALRIDPSGAPIERMRGLALTHAEIDRALMSYGWPLVHGGVMMRAAAFRAVGGYRTWAVPVEDHDLFLRLAERGVLANLDRVGLDYRQHFGSIVHRHLDPTHAVFRTVVAEAAARRAVLRVPPPPRPSRPAPHTEFHLSWFRSAAKAGNVGTAWRHGLQWLRERVLGESAECVRRRPR